MKFVFFVYYFFFVYFDVFKFFRRRTVDSASRESLSDYSELLRPLNPAAIMTQNLVVEIRQAVNEAQPRGI